MCGDLEEACRICVVLLYDAGFLESGDSTLLRFWFFTQIFS